MTNEIVQFTADNGTEVRITQQDVKQTLCPGATDKEVVMFLELCRAQRLNPFIKDAYLVKYGNGPASIITGKEVFTKRANAHAEYKGFEAGVVFVTSSGEVKRREGSAVYQAAGETLVGGWCRVHVDGRKPFYDEVTLQEYSTGKSMWAKAPATMIRKVALVHCLREAFPDDFQGLYTHEEMGHAGEVQPMQQRPAQATSEPDVVTCADFVEMASDEMLERLGNLTAELADMRGKSVDEVAGAVYASKAAQAAGIVQGEELTAQGAAVILGVLNKWVEQAEARDNRAEAAKAALFEHAEKPSAEEYAEQFTADALAASSEDLYQEDVQF